LIGLQDVLFLIKITRSSGKDMDRSSAVRPGEELPTESLFEYLSKNLGALEGPLIVEQFPAGFSNLTYLLRAGDRELVLRRPPVGAKIKTAHDMGREYRILSHLYPVYKKVPRPLLFCEDEEIIGAPFYVMERVTGVILRAHKPDGMDLSSEMMRRLSETFVENLAEIHELDYAAAGLGDLGVPQGYVKRQVEGWTKRYYNARTGDVQSIEQLAGWLHQNLPADSERPALIHNDYKYDNLVLSVEDPGVVIAVLDWEMATIGDPLMDFGTSLGYWVETTDPEEWQRYGFGLTSLPGSFTRAELLEHYSRRTGRRIDDPVFYFAYGLLKIATIVQQIYFRYQKGLTRDPRFAQLGELVKACGALAQRAIVLKRIDQLG
jgi:aminoglycoside phosphotransferase (APT) family kinase protein